MILTSAFMALLTAQPSPHDAHAGHGPHDSRQVQVTTRGSAVMPFDLERTTHQFRRIANGGVQTVTSDDGDPEQLALIRSHLRELEAAFSRGDFASPAAIHGEGMPGLRELRAGAARMRITYEDVEGGARLHFATADPQLVAALHRWFAAQRSDHGHHAASE